MLSIDILNLNILKYLISCNCISTCNLYKH